VVDKPPSTLKLAPVQPSDAHALAMENELLRHEVRHLRARLNSGFAAAVIDPETSPRAARNERAHEDLVWLLRRLDSSPAGFGLRRMAGFRTLLERYLPDRAR
jgi:hypothetical protein